MDRRGFLKSILAAAAAPYVVTTAGVLMPVRKIITPQPLELFAGASGRYDGVKVIIESTPSGADALYYALLRGTSFQRIGWDVVKGYYGRAGG